MADTSSSFLLFSRVVNHAREHVSIPEYTEYFRTYTDLGNQSAKNAGKWYIHTIILRTGAIVMINVGSLRLTPINVDYCVVLFCCRIVEASTEGEDGVGGLNLTASPSSLPHSAPSGEDKLHKKCDKATLTSAKPGMLCSHVSCIHSDGHFSYASMFTHLHVSLIIMMWLFPSQIMLSLIRDRPLHTMHQTAAPHRQRVSTIT